MEMKKAANMTTADRQLIVHLAAKHRHIENKNTDST